MLYLQKWNAFRNETILFFPLEALDRAVNKIFQLYFSPQSDNREKQPMSAASFPCCSGWSLWEWPILQDLTRTNKAFPQKDHLIAVQILFSQHCFLAFSQLWHGIISKFSLPTKLVTMPRWVYDKQPSWAAFYCWFQGWQPFHHLWAHQWKIFNGTLNLVFDYYPQWGYLPASQDMHIFQWKKM